jgi:hypothetical protein
MIYKNIYWLMILVTAIFVSGELIDAQSYKVVDTGQKTFYDNSNSITKPSLGDSFYGQDAQFEGYQPSYKDNGDGTVTDLVTGLMWQKSADLNNDGRIDINDKLTYDEAVAGADTFSLAGYKDWRLPTIKELYTLIMFYGKDPSGWSGTDVSKLTPFIDTTYFKFSYGDTNAGERIIDAQYVSSTQYVSTTMNGNATVFGVNFGDGRIKGYPSELVGGSYKKFYVKYVRGNTSYGINKFNDNGDGTVTDSATGLMWQQGDSQTRLNWQEALDYAKQKNSENYLGYSDWRLPNVKELQSIVDYSRSPATTNSAAIDPLFNSTQITDEGGNADFPFYWSGTTHDNIVNGSNAAYIAFGEALGWMEMPPMSGTYTLMDVHGAGAQRSDPKAGDPADYPYGHGPQGDVIRIYNYVRLVRDAGTTTSVGENNKTTSPDNLVLYQNYPNPFNPTTNINYKIASSGFVSLKVYDLTGKEIDTLINKYQNAGEYSVKFDGSDLSSGVYLYYLTSQGYRAARKFVLLK